MSAVAPESYFTDRIFHLKIRSLSHSCQPYPHIFPTPILLSPLIPYPWRTDERKLSFASRPCAQQEEPPAKLSRRRPEGEDTLILKFGNCQNLTSVEREER